MMKTAAPLALFLALALPLAAGSPQRVFEHVAESKDHVMEIAWIQDFSLSYNSTMENLRGVVPEVFQDIQDAFPNSRFALTGFVDKAEEPFGYEESRDYCFEIKYPLTSKISHISQALNKTITHSGGDWLEAQLHALLGTAMNPQMRWSPYSFTSDGRVINRFIILVTDAAYHQEGDSGHKPNNADGFEKCGQEDYPSVDQVAQALKLQNIVPIFLVDETVAPLYKQLVSKFNDRGAVAIIPNTTIGIENALVTAMEGVLIDVHSHGGDDDRHHDNVCGRDPNCCSGRHCCPNRHHCDSEANAVLIKLKYKPKKLQLLVEY